MRIGVSVLIFLWLIFADFTQSQEVLSQTKLPQDSTTQNPGGGNTQDWNNEDEIEQTDRNVAQCSNLDDGDRSRYLIGRNFNFTIEAGASIQGISITIRRYTITSINSRGRDLTLAIIYNNNVEATTNWCSTNDCNAPAEYWPQAALADQTRGNQSWLWGLTNDPSGTPLALTPDVVNNPSFGFALLTTKVTGGVGRVSFLVDSFSVTVYYLPASANKDENNKGSSRSSTAAAAVLIPLLFIFCIGGCVAAVIIIRRKRPDLVDRVKHSAAVTRLSSLGVGRGSSASSTGSRKYNKDDDLYDPEPGREEQTPSWNNNVTPQQQQQHNPHHSTSSISPISSSSSKAPPPPPKTSADIALTSEHHDNNNNHSQYQQQQQQQQQNAMRKSESTERFSSMNNSRGPGGGGGSSLPVKATYQSSPNPFAANIVFGVPLEHVRKRGQGSLVPVVVEDCIRFLENGYLQEEGILRLAGSNSEIKRLKEAYDKGETPSFESCGDVHSVGGLLKLYLRELPKSPLLMTKGLKDVTNITDDNECIGIMREELANIPKVNYQVLKRLFGFLRQVTEYSDTNKMTGDNLAIVFYPTLNLPMPLITTMIDLHPHIFD